MKQLLKCLIIHWLLYKKYINMTGNVLPDIDISQEASSYIHASTILFFKSFFFIWLQFRLVSPISVQQ